jgi:HSP20 family protein
MSQIAIEKDRQKTLASGVFDEMKAAAERIRQRAFEIFQGRSGADGDALSDWLKAENDLYSIPQAELVDQDGRFKVRVSAPGFEPAEVRVTALPDALIVRASSTHRHDKQEGEIRSHEFGQKTLFRRFDLPEAINIDKVTANLDKGVLELTAMKAQREAAPKQVAA